jgi:hypothetical protein
MSDKYAVVITTINHPTRAVVEIARDAPKLDAEFILIGDSKSPPGFQQPGATYLDIEQQRRSGFRYAELAPAKHYARKNVGYLTAIRNGATVLVETDDDNIPREEFWAPRSAKRNAPVASQGPWLNAYAYFTDKHIWPRGLPLNFISIAPAPYASLPAQPRHCPIQQGLADGDPDVDAVYRLLLPLPVNFELGREVVLDQGVWCPFNSQNTTFFREAFPLLYLPFYCSWRVTDIWRSFIAQRICWENGWNLMFHSPTVFQDRNEHDLMRDFEEEIPGYLHNDRIRKMLEDLALQGGEAAIADNVVRCYDLLIAQGLVGPEEGELIRAWLEDLSALS